MIASIIQICVLMNFTRVSRRTVEYTNEETEILTRKRGQKLSTVRKIQVIEDTVSDQLLLVSEYELSYKYISPFIEATKKRILNWANQMLTLCTNSKVRRKAAK
jgi:hypothetical protein